VKAGTEHALLVAMPQAVDRKGDIPDAARSIPSSGGQTQQRLHKRKFEANSSKAMANSRQTRAKIAVTELSGSEEDRLA
jgi:hypothetical protein